MYNWAWGACLSLEAVRLVNVFLVNRKGRRYTEQVDLVDDRESDVSSDTDGARGYGYTVEEMHA